MKQIHSVYGNFPFAISQFQLVKKLEFDDAEIPANQIDSLYPNEYVQDDSGTIINLLFFTNPEFEPKFISFGKYLVKLLILFSNMKIWKSLAVEYYPLLNFH